MKVIDRLFQQHELEYLHQQFQESLKGKWEINKYLWNPYLTEGYNGFVLMQSLNDEAKKIILDAIHEHVQYQHKPGIMFYMWNEGSAINWHHDDHVEKACTIYLTDWPLEKGGQFVYKDENGDHIIPIRENRMIVNDNHTEHKVTPVRKSNNIRYTIQVFGS